VSSHASIGGDFVFQSGVVIWE